MYTYIYIYKCNPDRDILSGKMSQEPSLQTKETTSKVSLKKSAKSNIKNCLFLNLQSGNKQERLWEMISQSHGEYLMLSFGEFPREEIVSTLSQILEETVPQKYYLSQRACQGILRRASSRGRTLPEILKIALENQAS